MPKAFFSGIILMILFSSRAFSEIKIDGVLDEPDWENARIIETFYEVFPYSLRQITEFKTQVLILETKDGIYFGFKNFQPNETMRVMNHLRDQERSVSDKNGIEAKINSIFSFEN